jgi:hypothetical protein
MMLAMEKDRRTNMAEWKLTFRKTPNEQGLSKVGQSPRGYIIKINGIEIGAIFARSVGWQGWDGWYYYVSSEDLGITHYNQAAAKKFCRTLDDAKLSVTNYLKTMYPDKFRK